MHPMVDVPAARPDESAVMSFRSRITRFVKERFTMANATSIW